MKFQTAGEYFAERYKAEALKSAEYAERRTGYDNLDGEGKFNRGGNREGQKQFFSPGLYVIGALPSAGKTTWTLQLLSQLADRGEECLFLSYEMSVQALCRKLIARRLFEKRRDGEAVNLVSSGDIQRAGDGNDDVNAVVDELADTLSHLRILNVDWEASTLIKNLREFVRTVGTVKRPPVIAVDYLQLVPSKSDKTTKEKIDKLLSDLRKFQVDTGATLILISSFNRANSQMQEATFSSFKESGSIEYTADVVWALEAAPKSDSEAMSAADKRERENKVRSMRLRCLKWREGSLYKVYFKYHAPYDTFEACFQEELFAEERPRHCK